jgi:hypothetical protein
MKQKIVALGSRVVEMYVWTLRIKAFFTQPAKEGVAFPANHFVASI